MELKYKNSAIKADITELGVDLTADGYEETFSCSHDMESIIKGIEYWNSKLDEKEETARKILISLGFE